MNKRQKAIRDKQPGYTMSAAAWEYATDDFKHLRKKKKMENTQFKEYRNIVTEGKFSKSLIAKAVKIAKKSGGQMTKAWKAIEKIKKGLGDDPTVADALRVANEELQAEGVDESRSSHPGMAKSWKKAYKSNQLAVFSMSQIKKAIKIAKQMGGNMTGAIKKIERMAAGLSDHEKVVDALKTANESYYDGITEKADRNEVIELKLFIENDPRLYKSKLVPIVKNIQKKMKSGKYDHKKAPKLWMYLVKEGQKLYSKEFDGLKFGTDVHKQVAQELADEYRDEIDAQGGTMFESKFYLQFEEFVSEDKDLDEATGNEIKKYMKEKWSVAVKASKVGSKHMRAVGKMPNDFRKEIIDKFMPKAKILNKDNINYGNIMDNMVTLRTEEWDKLLKENVATPEDWDDLQAGLDEGKYKIDHKTFTSAVQEALKVADKAGYEVDEDDYFHTVATGPKKPSEGKTNKYSVALTKRGKPQKKALQIQIYGKGKHGYELNCYIS